MATQTSYLQTLAKEDAIAFVTSLQKVQNHLSQELGWMTQQVQQKTIQIQGIKALLVEATELGLVSADTHPFSPELLNTDKAVALATDEAIASDPNTELPSPDVSLSVTALDDSTDADGTAPPTPADVDVSSVETDEETAPELLAASTQPRPRKGRKQGEQPKTKRNAKSPASKINAAKTRKTRSSQAAEENSSDDLRQFLQPAFRGKTLAESLSKLLDRATEPISINELIAQMYEELSDENHKRARNSISNVLSTGRGQGKWQNTGRGMYASNTIATA